MRKLNRSSYHWTEENVEKLLHAHKVRIWRRQRGGIKYPHTTIYLRQGGWVKVFDDGRVKVHGPDHLTLSDWLRHGPTRPEGTLFQEVREKNRTSRPSPQKSCRDTKASSAPFRIRRAPSTD